MNTHEQLLSAPWIEELLFPLLTGWSQVLDLYWVDKNWWRKEVVWHIGQHPHLILIRVIYWKLLPMWASFNVRGR